MIFGKSKLRMPEPDQALPGRNEAMPVPARHLVTGNPAGRAVPREGDGDLRAGLLLGRRAEVLAGAGRRLDPSRLRRRLHAEPLLRRGLHRKDGSHRGRPGRVRPVEDLLRAAAQDLLGEPRPHAGHAAGERPGHAVPLGDLHLHGPAGGGRPGIARRVPAQAGLGAGFGAITTEIREAPEFWYAEDYHQQYLHKNPSGYCGLGGTGVSCPVGVATA